MIKEQISNIIRARKSVYPRDFNGKSINKKTVLEILKNANTAPSHKLTQPWFYKVFLGGSKIKLAKAMYSCINTESIQLYENIINRFNKTSHVICVCMRRDPSQSVPEWEEVAATSMAVQNIWLSCVDSPIGGYWSTPSYANKLSGFLELSNNERCLGLFYLGLYDSVSLRKINRKDIENDIDWFE
tara:strand:+ start:1245 stop:1802 length:558 start_codon:yes stop_codon:yes gene_type:complete